MFGVVLKSLQKGLKATGILALSAGAAVVADPELLTPLFAAVGPLGLIAVMAINFGGSAALDALVHRNDPDPGE